MRILFPSFFALMFISACGSTPVKSPPNFSAYVSGLSYHEQKSKIYHAQLGERKMNEEPVLSLHKNCIQSSYKNLSVNLGSVEISDPIRLSAIKRDHTTYSFMKAMGFRQQKTNDPKKKLRDTVMASEEIKSVLEAIDSPSKNVITCLENQGWSFSSPPK